MYYHLQITAMYIISMGPKELLRLRGVRQNALGHTRLVATLGQEPRNAVSWSWAVPTLLE